MERPSSCGTLIARKESSAAILVGFVVGVQAVACALRLHWRTMRSQMTRAVRPPGRNANAHRNVCWACSDGQSRFGCDVAPDRCAPPSAATDAIRTRARCETLMSDRRARGRHDNARMRTATVHDRVDVVPNEDVAGARTGDPARPSWKDHARSPPAYEFSRRGVEVRALHRRRSQSGRQVQDAKSWKAGNSGQVRSRQDRNARRQGILRLRR